MFINRENNVIVTTTITQIQIINMCFDMCILRIVSKNLNIY